MDPRTFLLPETALPTIGILFGVCGVANGFLILVLLVGHMGRCGYLECLGFPLWACMALYWYSWKSHEGCVYAYAFECTALVNWSIRFRERYHFAYLHSLDIRMLCLIFSSAKETTCQFLLICGMVDQRVGVIGIYQYFQPPRVRSLSVSCPRFKSQMPWRSWEEAHYF